MATRGRRGWRRSRPTGLRTRGAQRRAVTVFRAGAATARPPRQLRRRSRSRTQRRACRRCATGGRARCRAPTVAPPARPRRRCRPPRTPVSAAPTAAPATVPASPTPLVVVAAATPAASAAPASTVVVVTSAPRMCKGCGAAKTVVTQVPCIQYEKKQLFGCGTVHVFFPVETVAPTTVPMKGASAGSRWRPRRRAPRPGR